jgi:hypothetical protein
MHLDAKCHSLGPTNDSSGLPDIDHLSRQRLSGMRNSGLKNEAA